MTELTSLSDVRGFLDLIQFTEKVSTKIHGLLDEDAIHRVVREAFANSEKYDASVQDVTDDGAKVKYRWISTPLGQVEAIEKTLGFDL